MAGSPRRRLTGYRQVIFEATAGRLMNVDCVSKSELGNAPDVAGVISLIIPAWRRSPLPLPLLLSLPQLRMHLIWESHSASTPIRDGRSRTYSGWSGADFGAVQGFTRPGSPTPAPRGRKPVP